MVIIPQYALGQQKKLQVPGSVVTHYSSNTGIFVGTPSLCILPGGGYLCSHNIFGSVSNKTFIFLSKDKGKTWQKISEIYGIQYVLFYHSFALYAMGVDEGLGNIVIRRSLDNGYTWTEPINELTGLLRHNDFEKGYHTSAVSVVVKNGRIWHPYEIMRKKQGWGSFEAMMLSATEDSNLLDARNWISSSRMSVDKEWGPYRTWLEGGAVISPKGEILDVLRVDRRDAEYAAIIKVSQDGRFLSFNPQKDFIRFPGGCKKFVIRYDTLSNRYWSLTNWIPEEFKGYNIERTRNTLALVSSVDLKKWIIHKIILQDENIEKSGFQYVDWLVEDDDIVFVCRTAFFDGELYADNQHNSNYITFHRIKNFRELISEELESVTN
ncbi:sialidase family protein [Sunxiuqinia elliptica]|nr:sialidase family protein [Sunxiuqinia elliptica]